MEIYKEGQIPGSISSTLWKYISAPSGQITFEGTLTPGNYDVYLLCCDGYNVLAKYKNFQVIGERLHSRLTYYLTDDTLFFKAMEVAIDDKLAIYKAEDFVNGTPVNNAKVFLQTTISKVDNGMSSVFFEPSLDPGAYVAVLQSSGQVKEHDYFEVKIKPNLPSTITKIGTGSCGNQGAKQGALEQLLLHDINFFLYTGDNLYIDTYDANVMKAKYEEFITGRTEFQKVRANVPILATWDDHDYGCCDEDKDLPIKKQSQNIFLDFYGEPKDSPRRNQDGIYTSYSLGENGQKLQIIVLDTRYFLDNKKPNNGCGVNDYCPWTNPQDTAKTMLGNEQWAWLAQKLKEPADLRLIVSSVQFSSAYHGFEGWSLFPYQRKKFLNLIKDSHAERVFFVSGDMHYAEISKLDGGNLIYPIYDFTASAINQSWPPEPNTNRVENKKYGDPNSGLIEIDWQAKKLKFIALNDRNEEVFNHIIEFNEMEFKTSGIHSEQKPDLVLRQIPYPGRGSVHLFFNEAQSGEIQIFDTIGHHINTFKIHNEKNIEITNLSKGQYIAKFTGNNKTASIVILME